jgi:hypothetical protein
MPFDTECNDLSSRNKDRIRRDGRIIGVEDHIMCRQNGCVLIEVI